MLDVVDAILNLVEPGGVLNADTSRRVATSEVVVDHNGAEPFTTWDPNALYGYIVTDTHRPPDFADREDFVVEIVRVADSTAEETQQRRLRDVSEQLDDSAHDYAGILDQNRSRGTGRPWDYITVASIDWDRLRRINERAVAIRITGWRYREAA